MDPTSALYYEDFHKDVVDQADVSRLHRDSRFEADQSRCAIQLFGMGVSPPRLSTPPCPFSRRSALNGK